MRALTVYAHPNPKSFCRAILDRFTQGLQDAGHVSEASDRVPLLHHEKALIISTTLFSEENYKAEWEAPMTRIIDDWGLRYPGVKNVEHVYFYRVPVAGDGTRRGYLERAYDLGRHFA
ncbi:MAG TPA: hypothetical protein VLH75_13005 [Longimicrobiales bacterium]|nr:hypothetical protein [Longimicrobiales bacterium]